MYKQDQKQQLLNRIDQHAGLVKKIAHHLIMRLPPSVELDDLIQVGMMGLMEAAHHFDASQGVQFETFASQRIRGAMLDELRGQDWLPRQVRRQLKEVEQAMHQLEHQLGRSASEKEIACHMGLPLEELQKTIDDGKGHQLVYLEDFADGDDHGLLDILMPDHEADPDRIIEKDNFRKALVNAITNLPEREKLLMALYYEQELNLKEIGEVLGVSESRISQLHTQAISRIRSNLTEWLTPSRTGH
ncbi:RNA polymerase sigma factor FliA [Leeia sp. TBRC 13508]|uniref:RNA polymerase sigma factor FliA n=1 Tax=Leeia speluncae TaxID=2884804 RepID=A0ABS8D6U5_9NEIS|nr:RNA polymerase sigma factor FliA [Leeia speluncae]MCB6183701.1 RNA polymerase sigma factor FliA [Leeia speluncae]